MRRAGAAWVGLLGCIAYLGCGPGTPLPPAELLIAHCGGCHLTPDPAALPKQIWADRVLPEMGARLGMKSLDYSPRDILGAEEYELAAAAGQYPGEARIGAADWQRLRDYILEQAPDTLPPIPDHRAGPLTAFRAVPVNLDSLPGSLLTHLGGREGHLNVGTGRGAVYALPAGGGITHHTWPPGRAPVVGTSGDPDGIAYLLEVGNIYPTEVRNGRLYLRAGGRPELVADSLHRPVHLLVEDLAGDGGEEVYLAEFGNYTGGLLRITPGGGRERLLALPGCIRTLAVDLDRDGRRDLLVLHAQGDEGITALYRTAGGGFRRERLLRFPSYWGTSWFLAIDTDRDGDLDLVTVHGDNADYSPVLKPYHGLRIYENDGAGGFAEAYFFPLYGATRVVADDFDGDGDLDLAVSAYFADFGKPEAGSFVYLERQSAPGYVFTPRTTPRAESGRWLVMEAVDTDGDGDRDIVLGSFTLNVSQVPREVAERWQSSETDLLLLENTRRD